jgi:hypothetical protein
VVRLNALCNFAQGFFVSGRLGSCVFQGLEFLGAASAFIAGAFAGAVEEAIEDSAGAPDAAVDGEGCHRAVNGAGAAFHAGIQIDDVRFAIDESKDRMRTDGDAEAASGTRFTVEFQGGDIF